MSPPALGEGGAHLVVGGGFGLICGRLYLGAIRS